MRASSGPLVQTKCKNKKLAFAEKQVVFKYYYALKLCCVVPSL